MRFWITFCAGLSIVFHTAHAEPSVKLTPDQTKAEVEKAAIAYFIDNAHPTSGLVLDKSSNFSTLKLEPQDIAVASIASTGFGIAVIANAAERGLIDKTYAYNYIIKVMKFTETNVDRYNGWFLHWVNWETGERMWDSEYSTIDTALFVAGALYAGQVFPNSEISKVADRIYTAMDFEDMRTDGGSQPRKMTLSMGYELGQGYIRAQWNMYAEQMILVLLGMGHPTKPLPMAAWDAFDRRAFPLPPGQSSAWGLDQALFVHQYSQLFIDFRTFMDKFGDYFKNSSVISGYHRDLRISEPKYKTLQSGFWGFSAGESPGGFYRVYSAVYHEGTACIGCALGSAMFIPQEVINDMTDWYNGAYHDKIWGKYGFVDSVDLDKDWYADVVLGITVGPAYLSLANTDDSTSVWKTFMQIPAIQNAMSRARTASDQFGTVRLSSAE